MATVQTAADRALAAEVRAVEQGHHAFLQPDSTWVVVSDTEPGIRWRLWTQEAPGHPWSVFCNCPAGRRRTFCKHAALVLRRLEREGRAVWRDGTWWSARPFVPYVGDPFVGLDTG